MTKEGLAYLSEFIDDMVNNESNLRIIKRNNVLKMTEEDTYLIRTKAEIRIFYHEYSVSSIIEAYDPFFDVIRKCVSEDEIDVDRLLQKADIYSLQKSIFKSYILTGHTVRDDIVIAAEKDFEHEKFVEGLINILYALSEKKPIFIILNKSNLICDSSIEILHRILNRQHNGVSVLFIYNELGHVKSYVKNKYEELINECQSKGQVFDWPIGNYFENIEEDNAFVFRNKDADDVMEKINDMLVTFAFEQADYYMTSIYKKVELEKLGVSESFRMKMLKTYILISIYKENYSYALILCEKIKHLSNEIKMRDKKFIYYYYMSTANMYIGNHEDAKNNGDKCYELSLEYDDEYTEFLALLLCNMSELAGWKDVWICDRDIEVPDRLIELCKKYNYQNHLAHIYVYCYDNDCSLYKNTNDIENKIPHVTEGLRIATELGNDKFLYEAYRKSVMVSSISGLFATADYFYQKSIQVVKKNNNRFEEANIYNGLGYNCTTADKYDEAHNYYCKALKIFCDMKSSDYIIETLYNMGMNAILSGDFPNAIEYLTSVINILRMLKKNSLRVANISKIFGLIALAAYLQENYFTAQFYLNKSENFLRYILDYDENKFTNHLWDDDLFLYFCVSGMLKDKNGDSRDALSRFERAQIYLDRCTGSKFFNYSFFTLGKSNALKNLGYYKESMELFKETREYFNRKGNYFRVRLIDQIMMQGKCEYPESNMKLTNVSMDQIMELMRVESIETDAKSRKREIQFFGTFQELINHDYKSVSTMINTLVTNFKNNFNLDNMLFILMEDDKPVIKFNDFEYPITKTELDVIVSYFTNSLSGFALSKFSNNFFEYEKILKIFDKSKIFSIVGAPTYKNDELYSIFIALIKIPESWNSVIDREVLDDEELEIYQYVFRQILDAIDKYVLKEKLIKQAVTDELTGLLNRKGYYEYIEKLTFENRRKGLPFEVAIMYMDLDHFKYYNDTYGHDVGDALLKEFSGIFSRACGDNGVVVRLGGDEFIIIINSNNKDQIKTIADKIYESIENEDGFQNIVSNRTGKSVSIDNENRATCSIGIGVGDRLVLLDDVIEVQKKADAALYYVKKHGRGYVMFYDEMN